jgi:hypothetical protein
MRLEEVAAVGLGVNRVTPRSAARLPKARRVDGGFNWSSQHLDRGGVNGKASGLDDRVDGSFADEVAGGALLAA